jgi:hypothetical protein
MMMCDCGLTTGDFDQVMTCRHCRLMSPGEVAKELVADRFDEAAEQLELHGWTQNTMRRTDGSMCTLGALGAVCVLRTQQGMREFWASRRLLALFLQEQGLASGEASYGGLTPRSMVSYWNDSPSRTKRDVVSTLQKAAAWQREKVTE